MEVSTLLLEAKNLVYLLNRYLILPVSTPFFFFFYQLVILERSSKLESFAFGPHSSTQAEVLAQLSDSFLGWVDGHYCPLNSQYLSDKDWCLLLSLGQEYKILHGFNLN